ncbi:AraC family transcriptional regulator [Marinobacter daepoensis]|uniref:AraC family transcriptional regulator n=1 Tax=Marinobacter daepoensis TaxID=262077 RepID=UPI0030840258
MSARLVPYALAWPIRFEATTMTDPRKPIFWRDARMPHVELRKVADGREVCYALHTHRHWSMGAITAGESTFLYRNDQYHVREGALVLMNPEWPHACNPIDNQPWAYLMLYVDTGWLTRLRCEAGLLPTGDWQDLDTAVITDPGQYRGYCAVADCLLDPGRDLLEKQSRVAEYLLDLMQSLSEPPAQAIQRPSGTLAAVADHLDQHCTAEVSLDDLCAMSGYSPGHLVRAFRKAYGLTPHAYLINRRIQHGQNDLKRGASIAEAALNAGFADQAHFQRTFKRLVAATPNQYRQASVQQQENATAGK